MVRTPERDSVGLEKDGSRNWARMRRDSGQTVRFAAGGRPTQHPCRLLTQTQARFVLWLAAAAAADADSANDMRASCQRHRRAAASFSGPMETGLPGRRRRGAPPRCRSRPRRLPNCARCTRQNWHCVAHRIPLLSARRLAVCAVSEGSHCSLVRPFAQSSKTETKTETKPKPQPKPKPNERTKNEPL